MDLDPDKVTNNMDEAVLQAEIMKGFQAPQAEQEAPVAGVDAMDTSGSGGGNIGVGQAQMNKDLQVMSDNNQILSKLKPLVNNNRQWEAFNSYIDLSN